MRDFVQYLWIKSGIAFISFFFVQRVMGFKVPDVPFFDSESTTEWFTSQLQKAHFYLEFGSGGSTYWAAKHHKPFFTVDSDPYFLNAVKNKIARAGYLDEKLQTYCYANIGLTKGWGHPLIFGRLSQKRRQAFSGYSNFPSTNTAEPPDLILVDGRFRVACALKAIKALEAASNWTLVIDDYTDRPHYHVIENFMQPDRFVGRMAVFTSSHKGDFNKAEDIGRTILQYETDPR